MVGKIRCSAICRLKSVTAYPSGTCLMKYGSPVLSTIIMAWYVSPVMNRNPSPVFCAGDVTVMGMTLVNSMGM